MNGESCLTCRFWDRNQFSEKELHEIKTLDISETEGDHARCRRFPPSFRELTPEQPQTFHWEWCGEYRTALAPTTEGSQP